MPDRPLVLAGIAQIPVLDPSTLLVDATSVVFDTFNGDSVTLAAASPDTIVGLLDAIAPIDAPNYEFATEASWLTTDDVVIGYIDPAGDPWAFPVRILNFHEVVNDQFAGLPVLVSYGPLCGSGVVFDRRLDGGVLAFSNTSALHENDLVMVDRESGSYWWQVPGWVFGGPLAGRELAVLSSQTTTWQRRVADHPRAQVLARPSRRSYDRDPFVGCGARVDQGRTPFPVSAEVFADQRLTPGTAVVVATVEGETRAWPVAPARTVTDVVGGLAVTETTDGVGGVVTNSVGARVPNRTSLWFAIVTSFPNATVGS